MPREALLSNIVIILQWYNKPVNIAIKRNGAYITTFEGTWCQRKKEMQYTNIQPVRHRSQAVPCTNLLISRTVEGASRDIVNMFPGRHKPILCHGGTHNNVSAFKLTTQPDGRREQPLQLNVGTTWMSDISAFQRRMVLSREPETTRDPSGENAMELT